VQTHIYVHITLKFKAHYYDPSVCRHKPNLVTRHL